MSLVPTPLTRPVESYPELANLERKWRAISSVVLTVAICLLVALVVVPTGQRIGGVRRLDLWPPFEHHYNAAFDSLVLYWWIVGLPLLAIVGAALWWLVNAPRALIVLGAAVLLLALILALRPIPSYPQTKETPGKGECAALLGSGPYGDNDEVCFDVRQVRRFDASVLALSGAVMIASGVGLRVGRRTRSPRTAAHNVPL